VVIATVAEPVATRTMAAQTQPKTIGGRCAAVAMAPIAVAAPLASRTPS